MRLRVDTAASIRPVALSCPAVLLLSSANDWEELYILYSTIPELFL